jgi:hypothetical protein
MTGRQVSQLLLGLIPVILSVSFGQDRDLNKIADILQSTADQLRPLTPQPQPLP